ncbi:MAG: hypothetical protein QM742_19035 [Aquabacterium sp.]
MNRMHASLALALWMSLSGGMAVAARPITIEAGVTSPQTLPAELQGFQVQAHFEASAALSSSLRWLSPRLAAVAPASLSSSADPSLTLIGLDMPLQRIDLLWDNATASGRITHARFSGGVVIEADRPGTAERVGRMTLSHFDVDLEQGMVRVDIEGAQGVGFMPQVQMWSFDHVESTALIGDASCGGHAAMAACSPVSWQGLTLPGLRRHDAWHSTSWPTPAGRGRV